MESTPTGLLLLFVAGVMNASFTLPMKFTRKWAWENTWLVWTIFALLIFPPLVTYLTVPQLGDVYAQAGSGIVIKVALFGAGWGVAQVFFGLAVEAIGIALAFSIILGIAAAVGSIIPLIQLHSDKAFSPAGLGVFAGVALVLVGVSICAVAGRRREAALGTGPKGQSFGVGLAFAILSGLGAALTNFGMAYGGPLMDAAASTGTPLHWRPNAAWLPLMMAGSVANLGYCIYLMSKNRTGDRFSAAGSGSHWFLAAVMAFFWFASTLLYGVSTVKLGELGAVIAWPLFMSLIVITASVLGIKTGEWKGAGERPLRIMYGGIGVLILAVIVLSLANRSM